jgi:hypothetical protein
MSKEPTSAEAIGLIQSYHDWYRPPGCGKKYSKAELVATLAVRIKPVGDTGFVGITPEYSTGQVKVEPVPHDEDIEALGSRPVTELMKLCEAVTDYYTITPSARRNTKGENIEAMRGFIEKEGSTYKNIKPPFSIGVVKAIKEVKPKVLGKREQKKLERQMSFNEAVASAPVAPIKPEAIPKKLEVPAPVPSGEGIDTNNMTKEKEDALKDMGVTFEIFKINGKPFADGDWYQMWRDGEPLGDDAYLFKKEKGRMMYYGSLLTDGTIDTDVPGLVVNEDEVVPQYLEQLIPGQILKHYKINTMTPIWR